MVLYMERLVDTIFECSVVIKTTLREVTDELFLLFKHTLPIAHPPTY